MFLTDGSPKVGSPTHKSSDGGLLDSFPEVNAPIPTPDALHVVNWWQAHDAAVESLTPAFSPPSLVTAEANHVVKIWSTAGEMYAQVPDGGSAGQALLWPPPHVLASQFFLMDSSKSLCRRLGLRDRPKGDGHAYEERPRRRPRAGTQASGASSDRMAGGNFRQGAQQQNAFRMPKSGDNSPGKSKADQDCRFATEPPDTSARDRMDSSMTEADASSASSGRHLKHEVTLEEEDEPIADRVAFTLEEEAPEPEADDDTKDEHGTEMEDHEDKPKAPRRCFSHSQMQEMIKNHAFSSGLSSYKQLRSVRPQVRAESSFSVNEKEIQAQKKEFFCRHASAFGVELASDRDRRNWESGTRGMGPRSTSEGALLRYARNTVESTTQSVKRDLKIDVRNCTMKDIRRPSFVARLDIGRISPDPTDRKSATAQAAYRVCTEGKNRRRESGLAGVGSMALKK
jgi:hypothetical protein